MEFQGRVDDGDSGRLDIAGIGWDDGFAGCVDVEGQEGQVLGGVVVGDFGRVGCYCAR